MAVKCKTCVVSSGAEGKPTFGSCRTLRSINGWWAIRFLAVWVTLFLLILGASEKTVVVRYVLLALALVGAISCIVAHRAYARSCNAAPIAVKVCKAKLMLLNNGQIAQQIGRSEIGLVIFDSWGRLQLGSLRIFGPDQSLIATWKLGSNLSERGFVRPFRKCEYPWALHMAGSPIGKTRIRSKSAPDWTDWAIKG
jgi:hypothetical protein